MTNRNIHELHSRAQNDDCEGCWYCGMTFGIMHHEHDHAPIPKSSGGTAIFPACMQCHSMKDRVPLAKWPTGMYAESLIELITLGRLDDSRDSGQSFKGLPTSFPIEWPDMPTGARLLWSKLVATAYSFPGTYPDNEVPPTHLLTLERHSM